MNDGPADIRASFEEIFARHDPLGLVSDDPDIEDEYGPEIETILARLPRAESEDDVRRVVHEVLTEWFEGVDVGPESRYAELAAELWAAWRSTPDGGG